MGIEVMVVYLKFYLNICSQADIKIFSQTPHSTGGSTSLPPDKTPRDFLVFPRIKNSVEGKRFEDVETVIPTRSRNF